MAKWCTVTVTDSKGQRHSVDVRAESSFDAAHLFVATAKAQSPAFAPEPLPQPTLLTEFEVIADREIHHVDGAALQRWILKRRGELKGPKGFRWETMRAGEPGGQHVNRRESAVRVTHVPTGVQAIAMEGRSQHRNRQLALARLAKKLNENDVKRHGEVREARWRSHQDLERGNPVRVLRETTQYRPDRPHV